MSERNHTIGSVMEPLQVRLLPWLQTMGNLSFELTDAEMQGLKKFQEQVKALYGEYGNYTFSFTPTGIGNAVEVYSHLAKIEKDLTDMDSW